MKKRLCLILAGLYTIFLLGSCQNQKKDYTAEKIHTIEKYLPEGSDSVSPEAEWLIDYFKGSDLAIFYADDFTNHTTRYYVTYIRMIEYRGEGTPSGDLLEPFTSSVSLEELKKGSVKGYTLTYYPVDLEKFGTYPWINKYIYYYTGGEKVDSWNVYRGSIVITSINDLKTNNFYAEETVSQLEVNSNFTVDNNESKTRFFGEYGYETFRTSGEINSYVGTYYLDGNRYYTKEELKELDISLNESNILGLKLK